MFNMVVRKGGHGIIRVVIVRLVANVQAGDACVTGRGFKVLRKELALFVEVVAGALYMD